MYSFINILIYFKIFGLVEEVFSLTYIIKKGEKFFAPTII